MGGGEGQHAVQQHAARALVQGRVQPRGEQRGGEEADGRETTTEEEETAGEGGEEEWVRRGEKIVLVERTT